ncbi:MAG: hypothetical protein WC781_05485 [Candidatus Pacearchaeota archaeon]|jgi:hypothetical protein
MAEMTDALAKLGVGNRNPASIKKEEHKEEKKVNSPVHIDKVDQSINKLTKITLTTYTSVNKDAKDIIVKLKKEGYVNANKSHLFRFMVSELKKNSEFLRKYKESLADAI